MNNQKKNNFVKRIPYFAETVCHENIRKNDQLRRDFLTGFCVSDLYSPYCMLEHIDITFKMLTLC